jgi:Tol biopolymer transport system component
MTRANLLQRTIVIAFILSGCSINISQPVPTSPSTSNSFAGSTAGTTPQPGKNIPVTWSSLNITGKLVYTAAFIQNDRQLVNVQILDLTTGKITIVFQTPDGGWVDAATVSPDDKHLMLSYTPPGNGQQNALYIMPLDGSQTPQLLFTPPSVDDRYFQPEWSSDGKYIYCVQYNYKTTTIYTLMRMAYPGGALEKLADNAYWPRTSGDGSSIVYVSPAFGVNTLFVSNSDGSGAHQIPITGPYIPKVIDSPMFLAGDQSILFSAPVVGLSSRPNWVDDLFGVTVATADGSIPSDWWSIPLAGGTPKRLTHLRSLTLFARFSPDKTHIASYSADGIFIMNPDGTSVTHVLNNAGGTPGTVNWIP